MDRYIVRTFLLEYAAYFFSAYSLIIWLAKLFLPRFICEFRELSVFLYSACSEFKTSYAVLCMLESSGLVSLGFWSSIE